MPKYEGFPGGPVVKNLPASGGDVRDTSAIPGSGRFPEEEIATHSSIPAWKIPWIEKPGELQSMQSQRVRHNWATKHSHPPNLSLLPIFLQLVNGESTYVKTQIRLLLTSYFSCTVYICHRTWIHCPHILIISEIFFLDIDIALVYALIFSPLSY